MQKKSEKITFKVVQIKFLAMHITNQISFDIFIYHGTCSLLNILMNFDIKEISITLTHTIGYCYTCYL